jgi:hypothetical protein
MQQLESLGRHINAEDAYASEIAARSVEAGYEAAPYRIVTGIKTIGIVLVAAFAASTDRSPPSAAITAT